MPYPRDGLYLLHKEGHYALGSSPLALLWKDPLCSRYFIDTDQQGVTLPDQVGHSCRGCRVYKVIGFSAVF